MSPSPLATESWWVVDGVTLDLAAHARRMASSLGLSVDLVLAELNRINVDVPAKGEWFPRLDAWPADPLDAGGKDIRFSGQLRPAPARCDQAVVATLTSDPRTQPGVKGPDLAALAQARCQVADQGADEAILLSGGRVAEGALSAVVWWRGDRLHHPADGVVRLPSTTSDWLLGQAHHDGLVIVAEACAPEQLVGAELWLLSALHGIRVVTSWIDGPGLVVTDRAVHWRRRWFAAHGQPDLL